MCHDDALYKFTFYLLTYQGTQRRSTFREDLKNMNLSWDSAQTIALERMAWKTLAARRAEKHRRTEV